MPRTPKAKSRRKERLPRLLHPRASKGRRRAGGVACLAGLLILGGCGGEAPKPTKVPIPPAVSKTPAATAPRPAAAPAVMAKVQPPVDAAYSYDPRGKINPFKPLVAEKVEPPPAKKVVAAQEVTEGATPLERMELSQLKLVAVVWSVREPKALVEDPGGKGYIIGVGTDIGKNKGKVAQINAAGIVVREKFETSPGKFKSREVTLKLYSD